jgi:hypothetical protein
VVIAIALLLRLHQIGSKDIWLDEANTVLIAAAEPGDLMAKLKLDSSPPLYYLLMHGWLKIFGPSEAAVRGLSALFGVLLVGAVILCARRRFGPEVAFFAGVLSALAPVQVMYSQEARMYTLLPLLALLSGHFFLDFIERPSAGPLTRYVLATTAVLYTHNWGFFVLAGQLPVLLLSRRPRSVLIRWSMGLLAILVLYLPWLPVLWIQIANRTNYSWIAGDWGYFGFLGSLLQTIKSFSPGGDHAKYLTGSVFTVGQAIATAGTAAAAATGGFFMLKAPGLGRDKNARAYIFFFALPLLLAVLVSALVAPVYVAGRTDQLVYPAFLIVLARMVSRIPYRPIGLAFLGLLVLLSLGTLADYYRTNYKEGDRRIAATIVERARPGDVVICTGLTRAPVEYHLRRTGPGLRVHSYPRELADHPGNQDLGSMAARPEHLRADAETLIAGIVRSGCRRIFVAYVPSRVDDHLRDAIERGPFAFAVHNLGTFRQSLLKSKVEVVQFDF